jgi:hypothetical protein
MPASPYIETGRLAAQAMPGEDGAVLLFTS